MNLSIDVFGVRFVDISLDIPPSQADEVDQIAKELNEIREAPEDISEWVDVIILAFDGAWRAGWEPQQIIDATIEKQGKNENREWPDWRTADPDKAIEHVRSESPNSPRTPRVRDRLGVDERDALWRRRDVTYWFVGNHWCDDGGDSGDRYDYGVGFEPHLGVFTEILEPRVLPSLDVPEARDGTVWGEPDGWRFWFENGGWLTDEGIRGQNYRLYNPDCLTVFPRYTEVSPDVG